VCKFDLILLAITNVLMSITARQLPFFQCIDIAFKMFMLFVTFVISLCSVISLILSYLDYHIAYDGATPLQYDFMFHFT